MWWKIFRALISVVCFLVIFIIGTDAIAQFYEKSYAIVIGINKYPSLNFSNLTCARNDAKAVASFLRIQGFEVIALYDRQATKTAIISKMHALARSVKKNDRVLVFFAGHGYTEKFGGKDWGYIVPYHKGNKTGASYISMEELQTLSEKMRDAKHQLFIMDSCYGGLMVTRGSSIDRSIPNYLQEITRRSARQIITAGGAYQQVLDSGIGGHSVFTGNFLRALQEGLSDTNGDGYITFSELTSYLVPKASNRHQTPVSGSLPGHGLGEFVFCSPIGATQPLPSPTEPNEFVTRGEIFFRTDKHDQSIADFTKAIELGYKPIDWAYARRGEAYRKKAYYSQSIKDLTKAIELNPRSKGWVYAALGASYFSIKKYDQAIADFTKAIESGYEPADWAYAHRGAAYHMRKKHNQAIADLSKAIELNHRYVWAYRLRASAHYSKGQFGLSKKDKIRAEKLESLEE